MRAAFSGWVGLGLLGLSAACLPEVTIDDTLGTGGGIEMGTASVKGGGNGVAGTGSSSAGTGGGAGSASAPEESGSGGAAGTGSTQPTAGAGGTATTDPDSSGAGGAGGVGGTAAGAAGTSAAAGAAGAPAAAGRCETTLTREEACGNYCDMYFRACNDVTDAYTYTDVLGCTDVCNNSLWPVGNITEKDSVLCRCYHAYRALNEGKNPHCYHAAEVPSMAGGCAP